MDTTFAKGNISLSSVLKGQIYLVVPLLKTGLIHKMCSQQLNFSAYLFNIIWSQKEGYSETAQFIEIIHNLFKACNERGIRADEQVEYWYNTHEFLTRGLDFKVYPSQLCSRYVKGMPVQTFEALLEICSTCIYLYALAADKTLRGSPRYSWKVIFLMSRDWIKMDTQKGQ